MKSHLKYFAIALLALLIGACSASGSGQGAPGMSSSAFSSDIADEAAMGKWARSCALCHVTGEAGAPIAGDIAEWQSRLAQGEDSILQRVIEGYRSMPPLGYCMACEVDDFRAMIGFMARTNQ